MEDRVVKVLRKFPCYLGYNLSPCEEEVIKSFRRFEKSVVQPHMWKFLKENINDLCVIREYLYEENSQEALDLALLSPPTNIEYAIEVKAFPLEGTNQDLKNFVVEIGKDLLKLLIVNKSRYGLLYLAVSYKDRFSIKINNRLLEIDEKKIFKVSIINAIIEEVLAKCKDIAEKNLGASNKIWTIEDSKSLESLLAELVHEIRVRKESIFFSDKATNPFLRNNPECQQIVIDNLQRFMEIAKFLDLGNFITFAPLGDIPINGCLKIRNFLFVIK